MYRLAATIPNEGPACLTPEVAFSPDGGRFAVSYLDNDQVRLFDAANRAGTRVFGNPGAGLDKPHGVLLTDNHLIVASRHLTERPATFTVHRLDSASPAPVFTLETPLGHLREAHSMALRGDVFVVTHCVNEGSAGALLSYRFDDDTGVISGPLDCRERPFDELGISKGVAFSAEGDRVFVNFNSDKRLGALEKLAFNLYKTRNILASSGPRGLLHKALADNPLDKRKVFLHNGIAEFGVDANGMFSPEPLRVLLREEFCRLENIAVNGNLVALSDTVNHRVHLYDHAADPDLERPLQSLEEQLSTPHGVKFSPDGRLLVVTNYGLRSRGQLIHWGQFTAARADHVLVFERDQV